MTSSPAPPSSPAPTADHRPARLRPIAEVAARLGLAPEELDPHGRHSAKLPLGRIDPARVARGRLILVSAVTPTPAGEGKTTTSIGLADGLARLGKRVCAVLREPSLGPVFGQKGGATGGGRARLEPHVDIDLHFNGDFAAVEKAHNLLAAIIDNHLQNRRSPLGLDPLTVRWKRVFDVNDRALRRIVVGLGGTGFGVPRESGFDITAASEVMAILCLAQSPAELKERLGGIFVGFTRERPRRPVYARDLRVHGAMAALLRDALRPNLVQTREGTPALVHGGPFANIAQGTNSVLATRLGLSLADWVVTEAGFGFDLGGEKFLDLKCRAAGLWPELVALVATVRALKYQGGAALAALGAPDPEALRRGFPNLARHLESVRVFGLTPVVVINRFDADAEEEVALLRALCADQGVTAVASDHYRRGGEGALEAAEVLVRTVEGGRADAGADGPRPARTPRFAYELSASVEAKIEAVATRIYGAAGVAFTPRARADLRTIRTLGLAGLPICLAKTQYSFSDQPDQRGRPDGFVLTVREIEIAAGAGFLVPVCGEIMRMPGLPEAPAAERIDVDEHGEVTGLD